MIIFYWTGVLKTRSLAILGAFESTLKHHGNCHRAGKIWAETKRLDKKVVVMLTESGKDNILGEQKRSRKRHSKWWWGDLDLGIQKWDTVTCSGRWLIGSISMNHNIRIREKLYWD